MTEELPYRPISNTGVLRVWLAERVLAAHTSAAASARLLVEPPNSMDRQ